MNLIEKGGEVNLKCENTTALIHLTYGGDLNELNNNLDFFIEELKKVLNKRL